MSARKGPQDAFRSVNDASNVKSPDSASYALLNALIEAFTLIPKGMPDISSLDTTDPGRFRQVAVAILADLRQLGTTRAECIAQANDAIAKIETVRRESLTQIDERITLRLDQLQVITRGMKGEKSDG